jgi:2-oxoglutarate ferredoxin oxidoreductase subunit beta
MAVNDYIRQRFFPHLWCSGCGHGIVLNGLIRAVERLGMSRNEIVMVSGIGCSSRISGYMDFHTLHTIHGRALAFATGVKLSKPELNVIVPMGDGDALSIGGNHFIHAARRKHRHDGHRDEQPHLRDDRWAVQSADGSGG